MEVNLNISNQKLTVSQILSVNGTVDLITCNFTFDATWDAFPARQAIFKNTSMLDAYAASILQDQCVVPWESLSRAGMVKVALVGTNTDGQVQRTETQTIIIQTLTLQGGVNSIDPTPDQYAQYVAEVAEMISDAGVMSINGMTGFVTLTASDVGALPSTTTYVSSFNGSSGVVTYSAPVSSVNSKTGAVTLSASDVGALPSTTTFVSSFNGSTGAVTYTPPVTSVNGQTGSVTISVPTNVSQLNNDSGYQTSAQVESAITSHISGKQDTLSTGNGISIVSNVVSNTGVLSFNGSTGAVSYTPPVTSVNGSTGAVVIGNASTSSAGLMSADDKSHLDAVYADYSSAINALGI